jgi:MFS family permease
MRKLSCRAYSQAYMLYLYNDLLIVPSNLAATMFAPGTAQFAAEFHIANETIVAFAVSIYLIGVAFGPVLTAPLSEMHGRLIMYHVCNVIYAAFTLGCALSTNAPMFYVFRFLSGCASSAPVAIGGGTIADLVAPEKRGGAMGLFMSGALLGPVRTSICCFSNHLSSLDQS